MFCRLGVALLYCSLLASRSYISNQFSKEVLDEIKEYKTTATYCLANLTQILPSLSLYRAKNIPISEFKKCCSPGLILQNAREIFRCPSIRIHVSAIYDGKKKKKKSSGGGGGGNSTVAKVLISFGTIFCVILGSGVAGWFWFNYKKRQTIHHHHQQMQSFQNDFDNIPLQPIVEHPESPPNVSGTTIHTYIHTHTHTYSTQHRIHNNNNIL